MGLFLEIVSKVLSLILQWPEMKKEAAKDEYAKFRNAKELKQDKRRRTALELIKLRDNEGKLP